jgi:hypothetical protein
VSGDAGDGGRRDDERDDDGDLGPPTEEYDLPADVEETLAQLLAEAAAAARRRDVDETSALVDTVETVSRNKVPAERLRDRLLYGCRAVDRLVADEPLVAAEYLEAMARLVAAE